MRFEISFLVLIAFTAPLGSAFAPPIHHRPLSGSASASAFVPRLQRPVSISSSALQMNLFDRFTRVAKSNLNNILKNLEDPEKIMNQAVEDMQVREMCKL
jgi:phage shock protein A